jgi:thioredoxin 1
MADLLTITEQNFEEEVLKSSIPVMIDFGPMVRTCKMIGPTVKELAEQ